MTVESQRCSELLSNRLLKNSFLTEKYANIPMNLMVNFQIHGFFIILLTLWGQSPKTEGRSPKEIRNPKSETQNSSGAGLSFGFRVSGFFRISDFDLRIYAAPTTCVLV